MSGRVLIAIYGKVDASLSLCMEMNASLNGHVSIVINGNLGTLSIYKNESGVSSLPYMGIRTSH